MTPSRPYTMEYHRHANGWEYIITTPTNRIISGGYKRKSDCKQAATEIKQIIRKTGKTLKRK